MEAALLRDKQEIPYGLRVALRILLLRRISAKTIGFGLDFSCQKLEKKLEPHLYFA